MADEKYSINIVVLGKTGAGKSSFCNYFFDLPGRFSAGNGKPVTTWEQNFQSHEFERHGFSLRVFDSVGIEPDNYNDWIERFRHFLDECNQPDSPEKWMHGFFYVINANSARVERMEEDLIREASKQRAPLQIILTNCDVAGQKTFELRAVIAKTFPDLIIHEVCSVARRKRSGETTECFGREQVLSTYLEQSRAFLRRRLGVMSCQRTRKALTECRDRVVARIKESNLSVFNMSSFDPDEMLTMPDLEEKLADYDMFRGYLSAFGFSSDDDLSWEIERTVSTGFEDMGASMTNRFEEMSAKLEKGSFTEKVSAAYDMAKTVVTMKSTLADAVKEGVDGVIANIWRLEAEYAGTDLFSHMFDAQ